MLRDTLKTLLAAYGPSGKENTVAETIKNLISAHVDTMRTDALGNLIVEKLGSDENGKRIMFSAHMDHIGLSSRTLRTTVICASTMSAASIPKFPMPAM